MNQDNPDEAKRRMQEINEAYEVLSDSGKRKDYEKVNSGSTQNGEDFLEDNQKLNPNMIR